MACYQSFWNEICIYISFFVRYKHDLTCNQFIQISCNLFWYIYIHISVFCKIQKWSEMQPNLCNFHVICSEKWVCIYIYISSYSKIQKWSEMQLIHSNFMSWILHFQTAAFTYTLNKCYMQCVYIYICMWEYIYMPIYILYI